MNFISVRRYILYIATSHENPKKCILKLCSSIIKTPSLRCVYYSTYFAYRLSPSIYKLFFLFDNFIISISIVNYKN